MSDDAKIPMIIHPLPDKNTSRAILYGDSYKRAMASQWTWDSITDCENRRIDELISQINDTEFAARITSLPYEQQLAIIFSKHPMFDDPMKLKDLMTLREIMRCGSSKKAIQMYRTRNDMTYRIDGIDAYTKNLRSGGITESEWKAATTGHGSTIEFDTIRAIRDDDEAKSKEFVEHVEQVQEDIRNYRRMLKENGAEEYEWEQNLPEYPEEESEVELMDGITIYKEVEDDPRDPDYWSESTEDGYEEEPEEEGQYIAPYYNPFLRTVFDIPDPLFPEVVA